MKLIKDNARTLLILAVLTVLTIFVTKSYSQNGAGEVSSVKIEMICISSKAVEKIIDKEFKEIPMLTMISTREIQGKEILLPTVLFVNPKTKTWTMIEKWTEEKYCVVGLGAELTPYAVSLDKEI